MILVYINGEVVHPGSYSLPAGSTLSDALHQAGGFTEFGHQRGIEIVRGGKHLRIDFRRVRRDMRQDLILENRDSILVPRGQRFR